MNQPSSQVRNSVNLGRDIFIIRKGKWRGGYYVYNSEAAFRKDNPTASLEIWYKGDVGQWVKTDDGKIVQVLERREMRSKRQPNGRPTIYIRVPQKAAGYYERVDGTTRSKLYVACGLEKKHKGRASMAASTTYRTGKHFNKSKRKFVHYLLKGVAPHRAYMMTWHELDVDRAKRASRALMAAEEDRIMAEIKKAYDEIFTGLGFGQEEIALELKEIAQNKRSPHAALEAIKTILVLRGEANTPNTSAPVLNPTSTPMGGIATPSAPTHIPPKGLAATVQTGPDGSVHADATPQSASSSASSS